MQFMTIHNSKVNKSDIDDTLFRLGVLFDGVKLGFLLVTELKLNCGGRFYFFDILESIW